MKKATIVLMVLFLTFIMIGCNNDLNQIELEAIEINCNQSEIQVGNQLQLTVTAIPKGASARVEWSSTDPSIVSVSENGLIKGETPGSATIKAISKVNASKSDEVNITVVPIEYSDPESLEIVGRLTVKLHSSFTIQNTVNPSTARQEVEFESSDESIATVDENGVVRGVGVGVVTITVRVTADPTIEKSFTLTVSESGEDDFSQPTDIIIQGENQIEAGKTLQLTAMVYPAGVSQDVIWSSTDVSRATVSESGRVTALKEGTVYIIAKSVVNEDVIAMFQINITPEQIEEPYPNMQGYKINIMAAPHALYEHNPFDDDYKAVDKQARQDAWNEIESNFNCDFEVVPYPDTAPWGDPRTQWLINKANINESETDIFVSASEFVKTLVDGNACWDLTDYYYTYGKNQMNTALRNATTYKGKIYAFPSIAVASLNVEMGIFYNLNMLNELNIDSPALLFNEGNWTYSDFYNYMNQVQSRLGENQYALTGEPSKYWIGMINAGGVKITDTITLNVNLSHKYAFEAAQTLRSLYEDGVMDPATDSWELTTAYSEGDAVFQCGEYWFVKYPDRWKEDLWGDDTKFGYVPYPYPDGISKSATRTYNAGGYVYMMAKGRDYPPHITAKDIYRAFTTVMLRTKELMENDVTFDEVFYKRMQAQSRIDDPESVEALLYFTPDKVIFDPIELLDPLWVGGSLGSALQSVVFSGDDYAEVISGHINRIEMLLQESYG